MPRGGTRKGAGRPAKTEAEVRRHHVAFRLTDREREIIWAATRAEGSPLSVMVRDFAIAKASEIFEATTTPDERVRFELTARTPLSILDWREVPVGPGPLSHVVRSEAPQARWAVIGRLDDKVIGFDMRKSEWPWPLLDGIDGGELLALFRARLDDPETIVIADPIDEDEASA